MRPPLRVWRLRALGAAAAVLGVVFAACLYWRDDILRTQLDPKTPFQTYRPPPAPDYANAAAWALLPTHPEAPGGADAPADVFFVHPTTFDGGRDWNGPIDDAVSRRRLEREVLPNYAGPYARIGRVFAPRYRQASLYARLTLRDDALDSRALAFRDVRRAFDAYLRRWSGGRPLILVGVEQGGDYAAALARGAAADPALRDRLVVTHLVQAAEPADAYPAGGALPACAAPEAVRCVVGYAAAQELDLRAAERLFGKDVGFAPFGGAPDPTGRRAPLCVNPVTGAVGRPDAPESATRGAVNATALEEDVRPPLLPGQVATRCEAGVLRYTRPRSPALQRPGGWEAGLRAPPFNLFYADLEADAARRLAAWRMLHWPPPAGAAPRATSPATQGRRELTVSSPPLRSGGGG